MIHISFLIGLLFAYWIYRDAKSRGSSLGSVAVWMLGSLTSLWFLFVPLYFIFGRKKKDLQNPDDNTIDVDATVLEEPFTCTMCGKEVKAQFKVCPYCGHTLRPKCAHCGRDVDRYWRNCPYCHEPLDAK
ncbi:putative RNA-binding Zn-ribbon protein involved in translation (DUF1610 family) [Sporomusaceae bacterium BoRhaA]|uniref:zinc ribbon domain-containing protein n=1 Tax=Pelorhabdus rhamnosifermentans TaxID=2772457 RepID=UPI001C060CF0|nr:zinc ribbon domain-containing protein [Pelorhabdus rhamnosifermentans]MBU2703261.1 putative RNA-binding Zn-ribbon protein involved in translation (DUF1610 family) [Pelorhabdus rhamnosifermentans]